MKFRRDKDILRFLGMSLGMVFLGVIISLLSSPIFIIGGGLILGGLVLLVTGLYVSTKPKEYFIPDERVIKNSDKAGHHAFWLILIAIPRSSAAVGTSHGVTFVKRGYIQKNGTIYRISSSFNQ